MEIEMPKRLEKPQLGVKVIQVAVLSCVGILFVLVISKGGNIVSEEPDEEVRDDLSPKGVCAAEIRRFCKGVPSGQAAWLHCLSDHLKTSYAKGHGVSPKCEKDIRAFKKAMYRDIRRDSKMLAACSEELENCANRPYFQRRRHGKVNYEVNCLREMRTSWEPLSDACAAEVFRAQLDFADDFILDVNVDDSCFQEVQRTCKNVTGTRGQVQQCMKANGTEDNWECRGALQQQEVESFTDIRLQSTLFEACLSDTKVFCPHVDLRKELVTECLEEHRLKPQFSSTCKEEFDLFMLRRADDDHLNAGMRRDCKRKPPSNQTWASDYGAAEYYPRPAAEYYPRRWNSYPPASRHFMLHHFSISDECQQQYRQKQIRASEDYRFDSPLRQSCTEERGSLCKPVKDGGGRVLACFKEKREFLGIDCKLALQHHEYQSLQDIDFDFLLKQACSQELGSICKNVSKVDGAPMACLLENMEAPGMGSKCKVEVKDRLRLMAKDSGYNLPLAMSCSEDIRRICPRYNVSDADLKEDHALACLAVNITKISSLSCKMEVWAFQKQMVKDVTLDDSLQAACQGEMGQLCPAASTDHNQTLACLRSNRGKLSEDCKVEAQRFTKMEAHLAAEDASTCLDICVAQTEPNEDSEVSRGAGVRIPNDLSRTGACAADIKKFCQNVPPGPAAWLDCLSSHQKASYTVGNGVSKKCKRQVRAFKMKMYRDIRLNWKLMTTCFHELMQYCTDSPSCLRWTSPSWQNTTITMKDCDGTVVAPIDRLACLRDTSFEKNLSDGCIAEVLKAKMDAAHDFALDFSLNDSCSTDADWHCKDVPLSGGQMQKCLRAHEADLTSECQVQLKRQEVENAIDLRLNVPLYEACLKDTKTFCSHIALGDVLLADCLEEHRLDPQFSHHCKQEIEGYLQRRAEDVRLDVTLQRECKNDTEWWCYRPVDWPPTGEGEGQNQPQATFECLQQTHNELTNPKCTERVLGYAKRGNEDIRFHPKLKAGCKRERALAVLCKDVPDGKGQVFRCLQLNRGELLEACATAVREVEYLMSEDISVDYMLNQACAEELGAICKDFPDGKGEKLSCLLASLEEAQMGAKCKKELLFKQEMMAGDYRYNYPLTAACPTDLSSCIQGCDRSHRDSLFHHHMVLGRAETGELGASTSGCQTNLFTCLYPNSGKAGVPVSRLPTTSPACKLEILAFQKQVLRDPSLHISMQSACKRDIGMLCSAVANDNNKTVACLMKHKDQLTHGCGPQVARFNEMEKEVTNPKLLSPLELRCGPELRRACWLPQTQDFLAKCLHRRAEVDGDLSPSCQTEVDRHMARQKQSQALIDRVGEACKTDVANSCYTRHRWWNEDVQGFECLLRIAAVNPFDLTERYLQPNEWDYPHSASENATIIELSPTCSLELALALNQTLQAYRLDSPFTSPCDQEVLQKSPIPDIDPETGVLPGAIQQYLQTFDARRPISQQCARVLAVAQNASVPSSWDRWGNMGRHKSHGFTPFHEVFGSTRLIAAAQAQGTY